MAISPLKCVPDTSVLIDLCASGLIDEFFALKLIYSAPNLILAELRKDGGQQFVARGLQEVDLSGAQVRDLFALHARYNRISVADTSALVLARALPAILLAGDGDLRKAAHEQGVRVHGTLWILDELVRLKVIAEFQAVERLLSILTAGSRLPQQACEDRLARWGTVRYHQRGQYNVRQ